MRSSPSAVEAAFHAGYPTDAAAVLLVENAGFEDDMDAAKQRFIRSSRSTARSRGAVRATQAERDALWAGRKGAAGATGRIAPNYYTQDVCVPRSKLPQALRAVEQPRAANGITVGNVFHAGDGNLHPLLMYDKRDRKTSRRRRRNRQRDPAGGDRPRRNDQRRTRHRLGEARSDDARLLDGGPCRRWRACATSSIRHARSIPRRSSRAARAARKSRRDEGDARTSRAQRRARAQRSSSRAAIGAGEKISNRRRRDAARAWDFRPTRRRRRSHTTQLRGIVANERGRSRRSRCAPERRCSTLSTLLAAQGQFVPFDAPQPQYATLGGTLAAGWLGPRRHRYGRPRDYLIGSTIVLADGTIARAGGMVVKNVAGYDMSRLYVGSFGTLGVLVQANLKTIPLAAAARVSSLRRCRNGRATRAARTSRRLQIAPVGRILDRGLPSRNRRRRRAGGPHRRVCSRAATRCSNARRSTCARRSDARAYPRRASSTRARARLSNASSMRTSRAWANARSPIASIHLPDESQRPARRRCTRSRVASTYAAKRSWT